MPSSTGAANDLRGAQRPRLCLVPEFVSSAGAEATAVYELTGNKLNPWQKFVLHNSLGERDDGRWAAFEVGLVVARQNGKDEILCARELAGLFAWGERLIIHSAHKFDTAMEHLERLVTLIENVPEFAKRVRKVNRSHGQEGITLKSGARIRFRARTRSGGGRGYTGDCTIFNEAMELPDEIVGAIMPTMSARSMLVPGPQIWLAGSAVDQQTMANGMVLARVRHAGIEGENDKLAYFEWSAPDDADPEDWEARAHANPALGYQIAPEHVETEFHSPSMSNRQFAVERLGIGDWPDVSEDAGRVIGVESWAQVACSDKSKRIEGRKTFALDANPQKTWASIAVAGRRDDQLFHVALVDHERGAGWLVERCKELKAEHRRARFVLDKLGPLSSLIDDLKAAKIDVIEAGTDDYGRACGGFFDAVVEKRMRYPAPQPELDDALAGAVSKPLGDRWKWDRKNSTSADISPIVAATLALWGAEQVKPKSRVVDLAAALREEAEREAA